MATSIILAQLSCIRLCTEYTRSLGDAVLVKRNEEMFGQSAGVTAELIRSKEKPRHLAGSYLLPPSSKPELGQPQAGGCGGLEGGGTYCSSGEFTSLSDQAQQLPKSFTTDPPRT